MKVLLINGSPNAEGNTAAALKEVAAALNAEGVETDTVCIGTKPVQGCIGCRKCKTTGICVFKDELYLTLRQKASEADGIIIGSPVYYAGPAGSLCAVLDRLFYSSQPLRRTNQRHLWPWPVVQARWPRSTVSTNISA